jgi:hypothetical protein
VTGQPLMSGTPAPDSNLITWLEGVIGSLLLIVGFLTRKAFRSPQQPATYENGKRISRQQYIQQLEMAVEARESEFKRYEPRITEVEDVTSTTAAKVRELRETCARIESNQRRAREQMDRIEARLPA